MRFFIFLVLLFITNSAKSDELVWNRYTTPNFTILSIEDSQGKWMSDNIESLKTWCFSRWGLPDIKFAKECRIFCVPNKALLKKLFDLDSSRVEFKDNEIVVMWLVLNDKPIEVIPNYLSQAIFMEFESKYNLKLDFWAKRSMSLLNNSTDEIRGHLIDLFRIIRSKHFSLQEIISMNENNYKNLTVENKDIYDCQVLALTLMLRQEFGQYKFVYCLKNKSLNVYGFKTLEDFNKSYFRYMKDLSVDVMKRKTPNSYLEIHPVK